MTHLGDFFASISVSGTKIPKRMYQGWPSVVVVAQRRCLRPYVAGAEGLVSQLHCFRLAKGFGGLGGNIGSVCSKGIG